MSWLSDHMATVAEVRDLREAAAITARNHQATVAAATAMRQRLTWERDDALAAGSRVAADNIRIAARLERCELVVDQANRIITAYAGAATLQEWQQFLADHRQVRR